jgi:uncharacterized membrane protein HdeD (DUF308 family)
MANAIAANVRTATTWSILLSVLMIVAGLLAIAAPVIAGLAVTTLVGWLLILSGVLHLAFAWRSVGAAGVLWEAFVGIVYGAIGIYLLANPVAGLVSLTFALALYLLIEGLLEFVLAFELRPLRGSGWLVVDGVITVLLAIAIWVSWPGGAVWALGTLVGISMFFSGITRLMFAMSIRRLAV